MSGFLRFVGVLNAAVWFGALVFFTFFVGRAFFSPEMLDVFGGRDHPHARAWAGRGAQVVLAKYFLLQQLCAGIAVAHLAANWLYTGKRPARWLAPLLLALLLVSTLGGQWLQPKLSGLHTTRYGVQSTPQQRLDAERSFRFWHAASQVVNLLVVAGVGIYFWRTAHPPEELRFFGAKRPPGGG